MEVLLDDGTFAIEAFTVLISALKRFQVGKGNLADYLICLNALDRGGEPTYTFDKALPSEPGFKQE